LAAVVSSVSPSLSPSASRSPSPSAGPPPKEIVLPEKPLLFRNASVIYENAVSRDINLRDPRYVIPSWNINGRPKNTKPLTIGFNFQTNSLEVWSGSDWLKLPMKKI
jgi:hypothetical protein